jgi:hypothetical protein
LEQAPSAQSDKCELDSHDEQRDDARPNHGNVLCHGRTSIIIMDGWRRGFVDLRQDCVVYAGDADPIAIEGSETLRDGLA